MNIYSVIFDMGEPDNHHHLLPALKNSIAYHMPDANFVFEEFPYPELRYEGESKNDLPLVLNHVKLEKWRDFVLEAYGPTLLLDSDILVRDDISDIFDNEFDIGITEHDGLVNYLPFNAGVVFVQDTDRAKEFMNRWYDSDCVMFHEDYDLHKQYKKTYAGMNQASLGYTLETYPDIANITYFPCSLYNAYRGPEFAEMTETEPKIVHLKGDLRGTYKRPVPNKELHSDREFLIERLRGEVRSFISEEDRVEEEDIRVANTQKVANSKPKKEEKADFVRVGNQKRKKVTSIERRVEKVKPNSQTIRKARR